MGRLLFCGSNLPVDTPVTGSGTFGHLFVSLFVTFWLFYAVPPPVYPQFCVFQLYGGMFCRKTWLQRGYIPPEESRFQEQGVIRTQKARKCFKLTPRIDKNMCFGGTLFRELLPPSDTLWHLFVLLFAYFKKKSPLQHFPIFICI